MLHSSRPRGKFRAAYDVDIILADGSLVTVQAAYAIADKGRFGVGKKRV